MKKLSKVISKFLLKTGVTLIFAIGSLVLKAQDFRELYKKVNPENSPIPTFGRIANTA